MRLTAPSPVQAITQSGKIMNQPFMLWTQGVTKLAPIFGTGSPIGVVEAEEGQTYIAQGDYPGFYVKVENSVGGDKTQGWLQVTGNYYISEDRFQDFTDQEPTALDTPTVVKYGPAKTSPNGFVSVTAGGVFQAHKTGPYLLKSNLRVSRTGVGGTSHIYLWVETSPDNVTWTPANVSIRVTIDSNVTDDHLYDSSPTFLPAGIYVRTMQARSSSGVNAGGLFSANPSAALTTYGIGPDPSASLEWHIMTGYNYE